MSYLGSGWLGISGHTIYKIGELECLGGFGRVGQAAQNNWAFGDAIVETF